MRQIGLIALLAAAASAQSSFDVKLSGDRKIQHALNRLAFGARPGDLEEVKRIGLDKWIQAQLHPETVAESDVLEAKLKPLETLRLDTAEIVKEYRPKMFPVVQRLPPAELAGGQEAFRRFLEGDAAAKLAVLKPLDAAKRKQFLASIGPFQLAGFPDLKKEADEARADQQKEQQAEFRKMNPSLSDLLNPDQMQTAMRGNAEQLKALFEYLEPSKRALVAAELPSNAVADFPELRRAGMKERRPQLLVIDDLKQGKVLRALYSNHQLEEELVDFWSNHFNVYEQKQYVQPLITSFERDAIRPHVFGKFRDLLLATARHPAMLFYLDNWESMSGAIFNVGPFAQQANGVTVNGLPIAQRQAHGLNENYGRELMELHTLGVNGGYTQADVIAVARCFTGWTVKNPQSDPSFVFAMFMHDFDEKTVLGHKIAAGGGEQDGLQVIDILARHPATAKFISRKLAIRFVADDPPQALVDRMAATFTKTDGDLRAVMQTMIDSPEFFSEGAFGAKIKSPFETVVSAVRAMGGDTKDAGALVQKIAELGEPLWNRIDPAGYPNTAEAWLNTAGLFGRINFAASLTSGQIAGVKIDAARLDGKDPAEVARDVLGADANPQTVDALTKGVEGKDLSPRYVAGLALGSPDFQRR